MEDPLTGYERVKMVCLFLHDERVLAIDAHDPTKQQHFRVPVGGRVEFGESSRQALVREIWEELAAEVTDLRFLGVLGNLFTFDGEAGHKIVFVYDARFADQSRYANDYMAGSEGGRPFTAQWVDPFAAADAPLYPDCLAELLSDAAGSSLAPNRA